MARRSARLASLTKAPKQSSEAPPLTSVAEHIDITPDVAPGTARDAAGSIISAGVREPKTPGGSSPMKPPMSEMHPSKVHATMGPPSSGLRLGFTDIKPATKQDDSVPAAAQSTPSRVKVPSSPFTFRVTRPQTNADLGLTPDAQRMMDEIREQAAKIREELRAKREAETLEENVSGRKMAQPKGKAGRFSSAHMAQFKKMDSIENHPSAFRCQPGRVTPLKSGVKRSQSKANLDDPEPSRSKQPTPASSFGKAKPSAATEESATTAKRLRHNIEDDASSKRPVSRDGSSIPVPRSAGPNLPQTKSNLGALMTPTKSSLARTFSVKTPSTSSLAQTRSNATISGIPRSATTNNLPTNCGPGPAEEAKPKSALSRFDRVKAMLRGARTSASKPKSALPLPSAFASKTPAPARAHREHVAAPMTTPGRKPTKRVAFTPDTRRAAMTQDSPSPVKSNIPQAKRQVLGEIQYPSLEGVMAESAEGGVSYPDLSARRPLPEPPVKAFKAGSVEPPVPGEFTFRSDHTINFGGAATSFGSSPGQASVRAVRASILPSENMPGSFPRSVSKTGVNKENEAPRSVYLALPHGMSTKKRNRVSTDEEDAELEAAERAAKRQRQEKVPEGDALLAPRLAGAASAKRTLASPRKLPVPVHSAPGTPSPAKRKGISLSRLNMLARPKMRK
ncbi:hypothetical protein N658DRAFT_512086 [Parathielavia hyrcaniae]|uniref:Erythromycin esterase n=1 Tax=Parathielavia hyrcaniae TaxID=113614 RepID=A0AAN6T642_9PEZI|nr:hypothetical protein N658DRAFT_512086 [Parathielavia hyrcaniae]